MKKMLLVLVLLVGLLVLFGLGVFAWYVAGYNEAVAKKQAVDKSWADIQAQLQRRYDLIPNLVATVKGYAAHEEGIFDEIAKARESYFSAKTSPDQVASANHIESVLSRLLMLQENYPTLKANENFLSLQDELAGTENRVSVARTRYNDSVRDLNSFVKSFFGSFFAGRAGVEAAAYFELAKPEAAAAPAVDFAKPAK